MTHSSGAGQDHKRWRDWLREASVPVCCALIGAVVTIVVALFVNSSATINVINGSSPAPATKTIRVTATASPTATATVTVTPSPASTNPGPVTLPGCTASQGCRAYNLVVHPSISGTEVDLGRGAVENPGDIAYQQTLDGALEIVGEGSNLGVNVTAQQANRQGCEAITTSAPDSKPILGLHKGLTFCVATFAAGSGIAIVTEIRPVGSDGTLYLRELYWPENS